MPTSVDPEPAEDEIECARCGAHFYFELTRCPNCGVNLYEPEDDIADFRSHRNGKNILTAIKDLLHKTMNKPYSADDVFGNSLDPTDFYDDLLRKTGGSKEITERLIEFERKLSPDATRPAWIKNAIQRWDRDNRGPFRSN